MEENENKVAENLPSEEQTPVEPKPNGWWGVLAFFLFPVGFILFLVWRKSKPRRAKLIGKCTLLGFLTALIILACFVIFVIYFVKACAEAVGDGLAAGCAAMLE